MMLAAGFWLILCALDLAPALLSWQWWLLVVGMLLMGSGLERTIRRGGGER